MRGRIRSSLCVVVLVAAGARCGGDAFTLSNDEPDASTGDVDGASVDATSTGDAGQVDGVAPNDSGLDGANDSSSSGDAGSDGKAEGGENPDASKDGGEGQDASTGDGGHEDAGDGGRADAGEPDACTLCGTSCCAAGEICCPTVVILLDGGSLAKDVCQGAGLACILSGAPAN